MDVFRDLLRYTRDAWGRETLAGLSFDLVWVAIGCGGALIALHLVYRWICARRRRRAHPGSRMS
jgi:hypothetical protein